MRVAILSYTDSGGGAARAALRLHQALRENATPNRVQTELLVSVKYTDESGVVGPSSISGRALAWLRPRVTAPLLKLQATSNPVQHSLNLLPSRFPSRLNSSNYDVLNLHWIGNEMLSVEDISRIRKPVIWTLHDSWAFCGAEHHPESGDDRRFVSGYYASNRRVGNAGLDLDRYTWQRKLTRWKASAHVIAPSSWLANQARSSFLMRDWPIQVIPNALNTDVYKPLGRDFARHALGLHQNAPLILFAALGGARNPTKGSDLLCEALNKVHSRASNAVALIVGESRPDRELPISMRTHYLGRLSDDVSLALAYSAADVVVVPSRIENLPQVATEALSCGTPVVAFKSSGLPDVVDHQSTGFLANAFDTSELAEGILWVVGNPERWRALSNSGRRTAVSRWSYPVVSEKYEAAFRECASQKVSANATTI